MDRSKLVRCLTSADGKSWRLQCDEADKTCLIARDSEVDADGNDVGSLERAATCPFEGAFDRAQMEADGWKFTDAIADAPFGWTRDERGRVFQTNFDLHKRLFVGGGVNNRDGKFGGDIDFALLEFEDTSGGPTDTRVRHRLHLVEGQVDLAPFDARVQLFRYDVSIHWRKPPLRITTFFGKPHRIDARLNLGAYLAAGDLEIHDTPTGNEDLWRYVTADATADIWQSKDMSSYVRLRGGVGFEGTSQGQASANQAFTPNGVLEWDLTLDKNGLNHLVGGGGIEAPQYLAGGHALRAKVRVGFERILVAINDQPVTLRLDAGAQHRDDIAGVPAKWALAATAGLRFSLWVPPR